jgi:hypothetical protein
MTWRVRGEGSSPDIANFSLTLSYLIRPLRRHHESMMSRLIALGHNYSPIFKRSIAQTRSIASIPVIGLSRVSSSPKFSGTLSLPVPCPSSTGLPQPQAMTMATSGTISYKQEPVDILLIGLGSIGSVYAYLLERVRSFLQPRIYH